MLMIETLTYGTLPTVLRPSGLYTLYAGFTSDESGVD